MFDLAVIGAGPAGIGLLRHLAERHFSKSIVLCESGMLNPISSCTNTTGFECSSCGKICPNIQSFGGCLSFRNAVKIGLPPCCRRAIQKIGLSRYNNIANNILKEYFKKDASDQNNLDFGEKRICHNFYKREYPVSLLSPQTIEAFLKESYMILNEMRCLTMNLQHDVNHIEKKNGNYIISATKPDNSIVKVAAKSVIIASGRGGVLWWKKTLRDLGIHFVRPKTSIGIRVQIPRSFALNTGIEDPDYKVKIIIGGRKFKSFCFCAGKGGGELILINYGTFMSLDGVICLDSSRNNPANFAILTPVKIGNEHIPADFEQILNTYISPLRILNKDRPGFPLIQHYDDFKANTLYMNTYDSMFNKCKYNLAPELINIGRLSDIINPILRKQFCETIEKVFAHINSTYNSSKFNLEDIKRQTTIVGLEYENLWEEIELGPNYETSAHGIYAIGDASSIAQGVLPSLVSGIHLANNILLNYK